MKPEIGKELKQNLRSHRRREDTLAITALLLLVISAGVVATLTSFLVFSPLPYVLFSVPLLLGILWFFTRPTLYRNARLIEKTDPLWKDRLSTAVDLSGKANPKEVYSEELTADYVNGIENRLNTSKLPILNTKKGLVASTAVFGASVALAVLLFLILPQRLRFGAKALFAPDDLDFRITALTADTLINPGKYLEVGARIEAPIELSYVFLERKNESGASRIRLKLDNGKTTERIKVVSEEHISFKRLGKSSDDVYVGLLKPFELEQLDFTVTPPSYTGEQPSASTGLNLTALPGSRILLEGTSSAELSKAIILSDTNEVKLSVAQNSFTGEFELQHDELSLLLTNRSGSTVEEQINLNLRSDEHPLVEVFLPGEDTEINQEMTLTLGVHVLDDYGLNSVMLSGTGEAEFSLPLANPAGKAEDTIIYTWDLSELNLLPGDEITYWVSASDADFVSGPKWGRSETYRLRFPDISELFSEVTDYGEKAAGGLSSLTRKQSELSRDLTRIGQKLQAEQTLSVEEQKHLKELLSQEENLLTSIDSLARETRKLLEQMEAGFITNPETIQKLTALSQMFAEIMPPELAEKLTRLNQTVNEDPEQLSKMLERTSQLNLDLENQLEQALGVMQRFLHEQHLEELAQKSQALADMEQALIESSDELSQAEAEARQKEIEQGLSEISAEVSELASELEDTDIAAELRELAAQMRGENQELSQKISESLSSGKMDKNEARKLEKNLRQAGMQFAQLNQNLKQNRNIALAKEMAKLSRELILISEEQEDVLSRLGKEENLELASRVTELERAIARKKEDIFKMASKSFKVPRSVMHNISEAARTQSEFKQSLIDGYKSSAVRLGKSTQKRLDQAAAALLESMASSCSGSCSSTGMEQLMQALSQLSLAQLSLNQQMGGLFPLPISSDQMTAAQRQALGEMLAQQSALRQQLEELARSAGQEPGLSGMLEG
ncbi:hypothetical protein GF359_01390, partial [candidate division WOR-3 bacterium]|nr:hypothetical protein [candidate division WOR-3 bacterium]MBD3363849.1 hypothetical protein [candidate division WOR-3 bacterium]